MSVVQANIREGVAGNSFMLEFYIWNGSSYEWQDYTDFLFSFGNVGMEVEANAYPHSFKLTLSEVILDNTTGYFSDLDDIDGALTNPSEPYGKFLYKRKLRISQISSGKAGQGVITVIAVAIVRDASFISSGNKLRLATMSLTANAMDQKADGATAERHPLGSDDATSPSLWTASQPAATGEVAMYRFREKETSRDSWQTGYFKNKRIFDIIRRISWALDDLAVEIEESVMFTADGRRVGSVRNIPPDDSTISTGTGDMATRTLVWNQERACLVCCVGNRVYDYDPETNTYTLQNTLTASRQIVRAWYCNATADAGAKSKRIVLLAFDVSTYISSLTTTMYVTVLDATGSGAYNVLDNETSLGSDCFPGTHQLRPGRRHLDDISQPIVGSGQRADSECGENIFNLFAQQLYAEAFGVSANYAIQHQVDFPTKKETIFDDDAVFPAVNIWTPPKSFPRGWFYAQAGLSASGSDKQNIKWSWGSQTAAAIDWSTTGGRLWFATYDNVNGHRLRLYNLSTYALVAGYVSQPAGSSNSWVPIHMFCTLESEASDILFISFMDWDEGAGPPNPSDNKYYKYNLSTTTWSIVNYLNGATGDDVYWMVMELCHRVGTEAPTEFPAILYNRKTLQWAFIGDLPGSWGSVTIEYQSPNRLQGLMASANQTPREVFLVENARGETGTGGFILYRWTGTTFFVGNQSPDGAPYPINTDLGLGSYMIETPVNYPDVNTPEGIIFGISSNSFGDFADNVPAGEYVLFQYANFFSGHAKLVDVGGLSFHELRSLLAESIGYVHYYKGDGTFVFKNRIVASGSVDHEFSAAFHNYNDAILVSMGWDNILNEITTSAYDITTEEIIGDITKTPGTIRRLIRTRRRHAYSIKRGETGSESDGLLVDFAVSPNPGEKAQWQIQMITPTTYDLYKLVGPGASSTVPKASGQSINDILRGTDIIDGLYLSLYPEHFTGIFVRGDNFTFWVFEPQSSLAELSYRDRVVSIDTTSRDAWKRRADSFNNRYITKHQAPDYADNILAYRKDPHPVIKLRAPIDPGYQPLDTFTIIDSGLPFTISDEFMIMGIVYEKDAMMITGIKL